jgi:predicted amidophosphoribosyltransferase
VVRRHLPEGRRARAWLGELVDLVLPRECAGCLRAGSTWCARCDRALARLAFGAVTDREYASSGGSPDTGGGPWVVPHPLPEGMPPVHAWGVYADPLRSAVSAWKDAGRRDLERVLAPVLAASVAGALVGGGWVDGVVLVVPAPSSPRSVRHRGDTPLVDLCAAAVGALGDPPGLVLRVVPALRHVRRVEDQSGLGLAERRNNLRRALEVDPPWRKVVRGRRCLLVDDVVTTGATVAEAARALRSAGSAGVVGAAVAATQHTRT